MKQLQTGSAELRDAVNHESTPQVITTTAQAISKRKGIVLLNPSGAITGVTLAAPVTAEIGLEMTIANISGQTAQVVVSGAAVAAQDTIAFAAASATVIGPVVTLKVVDTTPTGTTRTPKWVVTGAAGFVAGATAVT